MAQNQSQKKKKTANFSSVEKIKLIELVEREKNIIENKKTDNVSVKDKDNCWTNITKEFNSSSSSGYRDAVCLRNCWDNLKKKTRKHYAEIRSEVFKTGGGTINIIDDPIAERVKSIIQPSVEGLQNIFDSDNMQGMLQNTDNDSQCSKQYEDNEDFSQIEILEEENSNTMHWAQWTPAKLSSKKSKELQLLNNNENEESLTLEDVGRIFISSCKENCDPAANNNSSQQNLKRKKSKQLQVKHAKPNIQSNLAQSKMELVEILKESTSKKTAIEISILEMQLEKEKLHVEVLKKQLNPD